MENKPTKLARAILRLYRNAENLSLLQVAIKMCEDQADVSKIKSKLNSLTTSCFATQEFTEQLLNFIATSYDINMSVDSITDDNFINLQIIKR